MYLSTGLAFETKQYKLMKMNTHYYGTVGYSVGPASGSLGARIPAATDISR